MDMIDILMAKSAAVNAAKDYTDQKTQSLMGGVIYKGEVDYYNDLPAAADVEEGWSYTVKYAGTSGTVADGTEYVWGKTSPNSELGWISFSKDAYSKAETDTLLAAEQEQINENKTNISLRTGYGAQIPDNTDLNSITTIGTYYVTAYSGAATLTNLPIVSSGRLVVMPLNTDNNNRLIQIFYPTWNAVERINQVYIRQLPTNDGWTSWYLFTGTEVT